MSSGKHLCKIQLLLHFVPILRVHIYFPRSLCHQSSNFALSKPLICQIICQWLPMSVEIHTSGPEWTMDELPKLLCAGDISFYCVSGLTLSVAILWWSPTSRCQHTVHTLVYTRCFHEATDVSSGRGGKAADNLHGTLSHAHENFLWFSDLLRLSLYLLYFH